MNVLITTVYSAVRLTLHKGYTVHLKKRRIVNCLLWCKDNKLQVTAITKCGTKILLSRLIVIPLEQYKVNF